VLQHSFPSPTMKQKAISKGDHDDDECENIPHLAKIWLRLYHAAPNVRISGLDSGFMLVCACFFYAARVMIRHTLYSFGWPVEGTVTRTAAASLVGGLCHSPLLVPISYVLMRNVPNYNPSAALKDHPPWWQQAADAALQFCSGYFLYDTIVGFLIEAYIPGRGFVLDGKALLFLVHHILSLFYLTSTRFLRAGEQSLFMCVLIGETTNPPFNSYLVCQQAKELACCNGPIAMQIIRAIEIVASVTYIPFRAVIGPLVGIHMSYNLLFSPAAKANIPVAIRIIWVTVLWGIGIGSIPYVFEFAEVFKKHLIMGSGLQEL